MGNDAGLDRRAFLKGAQMLAIAGAAGAGTPVPAAAGANHDYVTAFIRANMPLVSYSKAQGTYLAWLDVSRVIDRIGARKLAAEAGNGATPEAIVSRFFIQNARIQINAGSNYGRAGAGHMRMNIATSRSTLELALTSMATALSAG